MHTENRPLTLEGAIVCLEPLSISHHQALCEVGLDPELWKVTIARVRTSEEMRAYIETALKTQAEGSTLPFVIIERSLGRIIGSTRYLNIDRLNRKLEIGNTWVAKPWQRTTVNTEAKYLLLRHAFETLGCYRVEFKTDVLNEQSRNALLRIGAKEEGILRKHSVTQAGRVRDTVYYSILDTEWPGVKKRLEEKLATSNATAISKGD
ncbi:MAG: GNAT family N-acetyltransferase [Bacteroidota bacterium]